MAGGHVERVGAVSRRVAVKCWGGDYAVFRMLEPFLPQVGDELEWSVEGERIPVYRRDIEHQAVECVFHLTQHQAYQLVF